LNAKDIRWYHNEEEIKFNKRPLGVIYLSAVYHCVPANTKMDTLDINVRIINLILFRLEHVPGGRKIQRRKVNVSLYLVHATLVNEMSGLLALNI
jgi:hypothetical protein